MTLDLRALGRAYPPVEKSWTIRDTLLYALAVGAGQRGSSSELRFTTENSQDVSTEVLPTFPVLFLDGPPADIGEYDPALRLHAEQGVALHDDLPAEGTARCVTTVTGMHDKGRDALVETETTVRDAASDRLLATLRLGLYIRGAGGFGGDRGSSLPWEAPARAPDHEVVYETRPEQALLYRLCGDRNPLHSDPAAARAAGFPSPILHGLCAYGFTGRALLERLCENETAKFGSMQARFTRPVTPGQSLRVQIWEEGERAKFRTLDTDGEVVIDRGTFALRG